MSKFDEFKEKNKFVKDSTIFYSGIIDDKLKSILTDKINQTANNFQHISDSNKATENEYLKAIKDGLNRFSDIYIQLNTEDKERICLYFEELMDIIGLESSDGQLNKFIYGFDPTKEAE